MRQRGRAQGYPPPCSLTNKVFVQEINTHAVSFLLEQARPRLLLVSRQTLATKLARTIRYTTKHH